MLAARISDPRALGSGAALVGLSCGLAAALATLVTLRGASLVLCLAALTPIVTLTLNLTLTLTPTPTPTPTPPLPLT